MSQAIEALIVALPETAGSALYGMVDVLAATGTLWRASFALELASRFRDTVIVSDEAYVAYSGKTNLPELVDHPNLVVMRTLSKIGMAGLRVGFTISTPASAHVLEKVRPPYNVSALDQRAAEVLLEHATA